MGRVYSNKILAFGWTLFDRSRGRYQRSAGGTQTHNSFQHLSLPRPIENSSSEQKQHTALYFLNCCWKMKDHMALIPQIIYCSLYRLWLSLLQCQCIRLNCSLAYLIWSTSHYFIMYWFDGFISHRFYHPCSSYNLNLVHGFVCIR